MCFVFDKLHAFKHNYTLLFTTVKIICPHCYNIALYFFRSGKLAPSLVKIASLPDGMSCKVWRTFVETVIGKKRIIIVRDRLCICLYARGGDAVFVVRRSNCDRTVIATKPLMITTINTQYQNGIMS